MEFTQEEIKKIKEMKIADEDWNTAQYPHMTNKQITEMIEHTIKNTSDAPE